MIRKTLLTATILAGSALAWAPPAESQRLPFFLACVELQSTWSANIVMEARDAAGNYSQFYTITTVPTPRCERIPQGTTHLRFTIRSHQDGGFRPACVVNSTGFRDTTVRVAGVVGNVTCTLVQP